LIVRLHNILDNLCGNPLHYFPVFTSKRLILFAKGIFSLFSPFVRDQKHTGQTSGHAPGHVQANFVAMPRSHAFDFTLFALRNPKACPLLDITDAGDPEPKIAGPGSDLRTDIPKYCVYRGGKLTEEVNAVTQP